MKHLILDWWRNSMLRVAFWFAIWTLFIYHIEPRLWWYPAVLMTIIYILDRG